MSFHDAEWQLIGRALLLAFCLSLLYDFLRSLRRLGHQGRGITFLCDLAFWGVMASATFTLLQKYSNGMLRWYAVGAAGLEVWLYEKIIKKAVRAVLRRLLCPAERYLFCPAKIFLTKAGEAVIMKIHPKRKEADSDETGI